MRSCSRFYHFTGISSSSCSCSN